jgi:hypothetical protein
MLTQRRYSVYIADLGRDRRFVISSTDNMLTISENSK